MKQTSAKPKTKTTTRRTHTTERIIQSGYTLTILDDYSNTATGEYITLDFSNTAARVPSLADEAISVISNQYKGKVASPAYFTIMVPAIDKFSEYAKLVGIRSFAEFGGEIWQSYMDFLTEKYGAKLRKKYLFFCGCIASMMKTDLAEMESN